MTKTADNCFVQNNLLDMQQNSLDGNFGATLWEFIETRTIIIFL